MARLARGILSAGVPGLDRRREDRSRAVRTLALPCVVALGWHPLMRITQCGKFRRQGGKVGVPVSRFVPKPGRRWQGRGMAFPKKPEKRLECTLLACWEEGYDEPWFVVTDLAPEQAEGLWDGMRAWIEHGYKLLKSAGWHWDQTRMTDCDRAERLGLVLAVATRYVLAVGGDFEASQEVPVETIPELAPAARRGVRPGPSPRASPGRRVARPRAASRARAEGASAPRLGDEGAAGQRVPPRDLGVGRCSDPESCVTKTSLETGTVAGTPSRNRDISRTTIDTKPNKPLPVSPLTHGGGGRRAEGRMPDSSGPGWALGANRPPAGCMTRAAADRGPSPAREAFAGRTVAGGLCSGTGAHLGIGLGGPAGAWHRATAQCARVSGLEDPSAHSSGPVPARRSAHGAGVHVVKNIVKLIFTKFWIIIGCLNWVKIHFLICRIALTFLR